MSVFTPPNNLPNWKLDHLKDGGAEKYWVVTRNGDLKKGPTDIQSALDVLEYDSALFVGSDYLASKLIERLNTAKPVKSK